MKKVIHYLSGLALASTLLLVGGCDSKPPLVPVTGQVLIDGKPLTVGYVKFVPPGGRQSRGAIQSDGTFSLGSYTANDGVLAGECKVAVVAQENLSATQVRWHAPKKYANVATSGLTQSVNNSTADVTIELSWDGANGPFVEAL